jgi:hypothetical protein
MRIILLIILALALLAPTGCSVLEEIDAAGAKMGVGKKKEPVPEAASNAPTTQSELLEQSKEWWGRATSLAPAEADSKIVSCRLREGTQFMSKDDCVIRGGVPSGVSG